MMPVPVKDVKDVEIRLYWKDAYNEGSQGFKTVKEFAEFLKEHPELAKMVGYVPKK